MFSKFLVKIFLSLLFLQTIQAQEISDLIEPVKLTAGVSDTILVSDLFYAKNYDLTFSANKDVSLSFNKSTKKLVLQPNKSFKGLSLLGFTFNNKNYVIPLLLQNQKKELQSHTFRYKPEGKPSNVVVIGSFNNWNRQANPLIERGKSGIYEATINLEPGNYFYKFSVDGKDIIDPENKETVPTGFDGFNSVLRITEKSSGKTYLHILGKTEKPNETNLSFYFEQDGKGSKISKSNIFALLHNQLVPPRAIKISRNKIDVSLSTKDMKGNQIFRMLISIAGKNSNIQSVFFTNGSVFAVKAVCIIYVWNFDIMKN